MNKQTLFVTLTTAALMCGCQSSKVKISGRFVGGDAKNIYLEQVLPLTQSVVDSAALAPDGSYRMELTGVAKTPSLYNVIYDGERIPLLLAGGDRLTLGSVGSVIRNYTVEGSSESELLRQFYQAFVTGAQQLENMGTEFARKLTDEERKSLINEITSFDKTSQGAIELSKKESKKIAALKKMITASVDKKTSMTSVTATFQDPKVAAVVADSVVKKLQEYIIDYRTFKAKEDCIYLEKLFKERQQEYYAAQKKYADYLDSHDNLILQSVRAEQERLQNDMSLAYQVYSQVAGQLQVARAKVQEEKPVFAVVEPAVVPLEPSGTSRKVYVLAFIFLSVCIVIFWNLFGKDFLNKFKEVCA